MQKLKENRQVTQIIWKLGKLVAICGAIMPQDETQMQTQEADGWSLTIFNNPIGEGKRMVVDRQKGQNQFRIQKVPKGRQNKGQGRQDDQAGWKVVQSQAGVKTRKTIKRE